MTVLLKPAFKSVNLTQDINKDANTNYGIHQTKTL